MGVVGVGHWTREAVQPDLRRLDEHRRETGQRRVFVCYSNNGDVELTDDVETTGNGQTPVMFSQRLRDNESFCNLAKDEERADFFKRNFDVVIIATADFAHISEALKWFAEGAGRCFSILIEKPMSDRSADISELLEAIHTRQRKAHLWPVVFGFDHYLVYALPLFDDRARDALDPGEVRAVRFIMTESKPIERERLRSVASGMLFDMASHGTALLASLDLLSDRFETSYLPADASPVAVSLHSRYDFQATDLPTYHYFAETAAAFTIEIDAGVSNGEPVTFEGRVGKAIDPAEAFKEVIIEGDNGTLRILLDQGTTDPTCAVLDTAEVRSTSADEIDIDLTEGVRRTVHERHPRPDGCTRHGVVVDALERGDDETLFVLLQVEECYKIVRALEELRERIAPSVYAPSSTFEQIAQVAAS